MGVSFVVTKPAGEPKAKKNSSKAPRAAATLQSDEFNKRSAKCPHCGGFFHVRAINGGFLARMCPLCGGSLSEELYDAEARRAKEAHLTASELRDEVRAKLRELEDNLRSSQKWWQFLRRRKAKRGIAAVRPVFEERQKAVKSALVHFKAIKDSRYHCGEWYLSTHVPLVNAEGPKESRYRLHTGYDGPNGSFTIDHPTSVRGRGIIGEFVAFEAFREEICKEGSPLKGARLLPNLYIPKQVGLRGNAHWEQVDLVLATRSCAFVIEVKKRYADISTKVPFEQIKSNAPGPRGEGEPLRDFSWPLEQNSQHALAFADACDAYDFERVFELVLFVNPRSFKTDATCFYDHVLVSALPDKRKALLSAIALATTSHEDVMSQSELDAMADRMINAYGDLNQQRGNLHISHVSA